MTVRVTMFVENPRHSRVHHRYDEKSLAFLGTASVVGSYPYPYGFIPNTKAEDGDCLDCYLLTERDVDRGGLYECEIVGLMEVWENDEEDHKVLLRFPDEIVDLQSETLKRFEQSAIPGSKTRVGRFLGVDGTIAYLQKFGLLST